MVRVEVPAPEAEMAADLLWAAGASAVEEAVVAVGAGGAEVIVLTVDLEACPDTIAGRWPCFAAEDDGAWWDGWRPFARTARAGRFLVRPPWVEVTATDESAAALDLVVDPGRSFGTGSHPSTLLALEVVDRIVGPGTAVLDIGCGSGILAIGAALLGADGVVAIDVDAAALDATEANAAANGVGGRVRVSGTPLADVDGRFDLVLANLGSPLVVDLAGEISARVAPGGTLVLSGMLDQRWEHVAGAYPALRTVATPGREGWRAVVLTNAVADG